METVSPAKLRVLVLDDNESVRSALHQLLTAKGFQVFSYPEPGDCPLRQSDRCHCAGAEVCADALITDLDMPQISGAEFVAELMQKGCKIPHFAILTGNRESGALAQAANWPCKVFVKPEGVTALLEWLDGINAKLQPRRRLASCAL